MTSLNNNTEHFMYQESFQCFASVNSLNLTKPSGVDTIMVLSFFLLQKRHQSPETIGVKINFMSNPQDPISGFPLCNFLPRYLILPPSVKSHLLLLASKSAPLFLIQASEALWKELTSQRTLAIKFAASILLIRLVKLDLNENYIK